MESLGRGGASRASRREHAYITTTHTSFILFRSPVVPVDKRSDEGHRFISLLPPEELKALWRRLVQLAAPDQSRFVRRVAEITKGVAAVTGLLERLAGLLRQAVHVVGWLVLLWGAAVLPFQGHPSPEHLVVPGAGLLAVLQGAVPAWLHRHLLRSTVASPSHEPGLRTGESGVEGDTPESGSGDVAFDGVMEDVERIPQV